MTSAPYWLTMGDWTKQSINTGKPSGSHSRNEPSVWLRSMPACPRSLKVTTNRPTPPSASCLLNSALSDSYEAATRLYARAFSGTQTDGDAYLNYGFTAACAALRAGRGEGARPVPLSENERTCRAGQAGQWLQSNLAAWSQRLENRPVDYRPAIQRTLSQWLASRDLIALRDQELLDALSPEEAQQCRMLWRDLDEVLKRTQVID
jgi:hypothetical protein